MPDDELQRLDRLLAQLVQVLDAPGETADKSPETTWRRLDLLFAAMGADALRATLRRQGMDRVTIDEALDRLNRRRAAMSAPSAGEP
jgi:hypothetical protein